MSKTIEFKENLCKTLYDFLITKGYTPYRDDYDNGSITIDFPKDEDDFSVMNIGFTNYDKYTESSYYDEQEVNSINVSKDTIIIDGEKEELFNNDLSCEELEDIVNDVMRYINNK